MSKNLTKSSDWIQREISDLSLEKDELAVNADAINKRVEEPGQQHRPKY